jgi:hypothetical protein
MKLTPALATPFTVTTTGPDVAPLGTGINIDVALQDVGVAATPLKVTVPTVGSQPKFVPEIVTIVPGNPEIGNKLLMIGVGGATVNGTPLLTCAEVMS